MDGGSRHIIHAQMGTDLSDHESYMYLFLSLLCFFFPRAIYSTIDQNDRGKHSHLRYKDNINMLPLYLLFLLSDEHKRGNQRRENDLQLHLEDDNKDGEYAWIPDLKSRYAKFVGKADDVTASLPRQLLWPKGISGFYEVPFVIQKGQFSAWAIQNLIHWAMRFIEHGSNIRFREAVSSDKNMIYFVNGQGCFSIVGRSFSPSPQRISLNVPECMFHHSVLHEVLHALGLNHEHQRPDSADFILTPSQAPESLLRHVTSNPLISTSVTPYNLASIMHYNLFLTAKNPNHQSVLGTRSPALSSCDWYNLNMLYPGPVGPPPCVPHEHVKACEPLFDCPFGDLLCIEMCERDCDTGLPRGDDIEVRYPPFCQFVGGAKYPPLPEALYIQIKELQELERRTIIEAAANNRT